MLSDYRTWLASELELLGNASHHAYAFGQANMAKRAIEQLDREIDGGVVVQLSVAEAAGIATALEMLLERTSALPPELALLRDRLNAAVSATHPHDRVANYAPPPDPAPQTNIAESETSFGEPGTGIAESETGIAESETAFGEPGTG